MLHPFHSTRVYQHSSKRNKTTKIVTAENNYFGDNKEQSLDDKMKSVGAFQNKSNVDKKKWMNGYNNTRDKNTTF